MPKLSRFEPQNPIPKEKYPKYLKFIIGAFLVAVIAEVWVVSRLSTTGSIVSELETKKNDLLLQNQILEDEIAKNSSLLKIEKNAELLGFTQIKNFQYFQDKDATDPAEMKKDE